MNLPRAVRLDRERIEENRSDDAADARALLALTVHGGLSGDVDVELIQRVLADSLSRAIAPDGDAVETLTGIVERLVGVLSAMGELAGRAMVRVAAEGGVDLEAVMADLWAEHAGEG